MTSRFTRTPPGLVAKWQFHPVPTVWVEGPTDIWFYRPALGGLDCRIESFSGRENANALVEGLKAHNYPYLVVLDGDYEALTNKRSPHRRVIRLRRYSFENYLWEKAPFDEVCLSHAQCGDNPDTCRIEFDKTIQHIHATLLDVITLDIAARRMESPPKVLPDTIDPLLSAPRKHTLDSRRVLQITKACDRQILEDHKTEARKLLAVYLAGRRTVDILRGHLAFGLLRYLFSGLVLKIRRQRAVISDDALTQMLCNAVWRKPPSDDHRELKKKLRKQVRSAIQAMEAMGP